MSTTTAYLAPLTREELAILGEKLHRAVIKTSVSHCGGAETHALVTEISDDTWDERHSRKVRFQVGDPDNGPFTCTHEAADEAEAEAYVTKNYGPVADAMEYPDSDGKIIILYIVIDA